MVGKGPWVVTTKKILVSAFLVVHISATVIYVIPRSPIRDRFVQTASYYLLPLGLWQSWSMFAPDPVRDSYTLEAEVVDAQGLRHNFDFPKLADYHGLATLPAFRHPKFAANLGPNDATVSRRLAAHHAVRRLDLPAESYPLNVALIYRVVLTPPPGSSAVDPMTPPTIYTLARVHVETPSEVRP